MSSRTLSRSTTTSMVCLCVLASLGSASISWIWPSTRSLAKALRAQLGEEIELLALAVGDHRRQDHQPAALGQRQHVVDHLRDGLRFERQLVFRAVRRAGTGEEQAQVVVDFGDRADGRARVVAGRLLLDRDRRRKALDQVDVRLLHALQELPA
jgi:hypothetical protein